MPTTAEGSALLAEFKVRQFCAWQHKIGCILI